MKKYFKILIIIMFLLFNRVYAKENTINNDTINLLLTSSETGEGWDWNKDMLTLTLNDFNLDVTNKYGIILPDANIIINLNGENNINCNSNQKVRAIVVDNGSITFKGKGSLNINIDGNNESSMAIGSIKGSVILDNTNININVSNSYDKSTTVGIYSYELLKLDGGKYNINVKDNSDEENSSFARSMYSIKDVSINNAELNINTYSKMGTALSLISVSGNTNIYNSKLNFKNEGYTNSGGIWSYNDIDINDSTFSMESIANIKNSMSTESITSVDSMKNRVVSAYGLWAENSINVNNTKVKANVNSSASSTSGIGSINAINIRDSKVVIKTNNENAEYDYGIGHTKSITIDNSNIKIDAKDAAIYAAGAINLIDSKIKSNGSIVKTSGNNYETIASTDATITITEYGIKGSLTSLVIERNISIWLIIIIIVVILLIVIGVICCFLKKRKGKKRSKK